MRLQSSRVVPLRIRALSPPAVRRLRRLTQTGVLLAIVLILVVAYSPPVPTWTTLPARLNPLLMLTASLAGRTLLAGAWLALIVLALTLVLGRVWCGWFCPLGTILDWIQPKPRRLRRGRQVQLSPPPEQWRSAKYVLLLALVGIALLGSLTLIFLDPISLFTRTFAGVVWPAVGQTVYSLEAWLYRFDLLWAPLDAVHSRVVYPLFRDLQPVYDHALPILLLFVGIVLLNWWAPRFWCRYLCPLGALLGLVAKGALVRRQVGESCRSCALCLPHCPTSTIDPRAGFRSDPAECTVCYECLVDCPEQGIAFRLQRPWAPAVWQGYDPGRRTVVAGLGAAVAGAALVGVEPSSRQTPAHLLRPPGALLTGFASLCIRCGACLRACPTNGLQSTLVEGGWQTLMTPRLVPRLGYCLYSCTACAEVCPTGAIPLLALAEKQQTPIGLARIDRDRCLPWAYATPCIVCEEMCPVPDKAIWLEEVTVVAGDGETIQVQRPAVHKERCIGCGICEYKCPMGGEAAIRVFAQPV